VLLILFKKSPFSFSLLTSRESRHRAGYGQRIAWLRIGKQFQNWQIVAIVKIAKPSEAAHRYRRARAKIGDWIAMRARDVIES
jgi:hypothetical protein